MPRAKAHYGTKPTVEFATYLTRIDGYRKVAEDNSTKAQFLAAMQDLSVEPDRLVSDADRTRAAEAMAWAASQGGNDYLERLAEGAALEVLPPKLLGVMLSLPAAYDRYLANEAKAAAKAAAGAGSEFVGTEGDRAVFTVTITDQRHLDWGTVTEAMDQDGNVMSWFTNLDAGIGDTLTVKGTVKAHREFRGVRQTTINRVALAA